jgi:hypothetical protein
MRLIHCKSDDETEKMIHFIMAHRKEINPSYNVKTTFFSIGTQLFCGDTFLVTNGQNEVIGYVGFIYGTPEKQFQDTNKVRIEMVYIEEKYRCTRLFAKGFKQLVDHIELAGKGTTYIEFYAYKENETLCRLCSKFAKVESESKSHFGEEILYSTSIEDLKGYLRKNTQGQNSRC